MAGRGLVTAMSLEDLEDDIEANYGDLPATLEVPLDRETKHEMAMLTAVLDGDRADLVQRAIHILFQTTVEAGKLDFHLRNEYGVTYDEYLAGMTYDDMTGADQFPQSDDDRRYQF
jgi:hypothetical protein